MPLPDDIQILARRAPGPPGEPLASGASDVEIDAFAARTGVPIPLELREWLRFTNGPMLGPGGCMGVGARLLSADIEAIYGLKPAWQAAHWLPVAGDGCGDYYILAPEGKFGRARPVFFWEHEQSDDLAAGYAVASGLWPFLRFLLKKELGERGWPFDRKKVIADDPEVVNVTGVALPWDT